MEVLHQFKDSVSTVIATANEIIASCVDGTVRVFDLRAGRIVEDHICSTCADFARAPHPLISLPRFVGGDADLRRQNR
jgi:hypothetical protein